MVLKITYTKCYFKALNISMGKKEILFFGTGTALITPFKNGKVDYNSLEIIIKKQIEAGVGAVVVLGTTGEAATISLTEREKIIELAVKLCKNKCKVIVGCGSNNTNSAIKLYKMAERLGADGALIVTPYYNKCTQNGVLEHYKAIAKAGNMPIIVYNVPSRTGVNIEPQTLLQLSEIKNIVGVKEASGNISQIMELFYLLKDKMAIYSGDDALNYIFLSLGGSGCISVLANIMPEKCEKLYQIHLQKGATEAASFWIKFLPIIKSMFIEVNPIPIKYAMSQIGLCKNELRLPLTRLSAKNENILNGELNKVWAQDDSL